MNAYRRPLEALGDALAKHAFSDRVHRSTREKGGTKSLADFAEHYMVCDSPVCMGDYTAFLVAYCSSQSEEGLKALASALRERHRAFLGRAAGFLKREAMLGCEVQVARIGEYRGPNIVRKDFLTPGRAAGDAPKRASSLASTDDLPMGRSWLPTSAKFVRGHIAKTGFAHKMTK